uniref:Homeobox protein 4-like n=1 Tax=Dermatophagoides pteronyssinus TaxID=6956 RepID=A0A6P6XZZ6_DERPT|nr:homeobox protein 4-like [Dermatophagoides pteronyssinus]
MVDINIPSDNHFGMLLPSYSNTEQTTMIGNDYLDSIDENDLITFINSGNFDHSSSSPPSSSDQYFIDTPPETPVNHQMTTTNNIVDFYNNNNNVVNNLMDWNGNYHEINSSSSSSNNHHSDSDNSNGSFTVNTCHPMIYTTDNKTDTLSKITGKNGHNSLLENNGRRISSNAHHHQNIQPKATTNKISNHKLKEQRENLQKQKLEARKLRNRETALNSRLKKKEYLENLETQVKRLGKENTDLMLENALLKQKILDLEQEIGRFRLLDMNGNFTDSSVVANNQKKVKISFFAVVFMFLYQISPYLISMSAEQNGNHNISPNIIVFPNQNFTANSFNNDGNDHHILRKLLWKGEEQDYFRKFSTNNFQSQNSQQYYSNQTKIGCENYYNRTDLIRLENELRGWLTRFKLEENESRRRQQQHSTSSKSKKKLLYNLKHVPIPRLKLWMIQKQRYMDYLNEESPSEHSSSSFDDDSHFVPYDLENLMSTIHRRDDTFYYLSYPSKGHLILPPMSNRTDIRPRFSFLIPTVYNFNQQSNNSNNTNHHNHNETGLTLPSDHLYMLQIDCQVINTKVTLININDQHQYGKRKLRSSSKSSISGNGK